MAPPLAMVDLGLRDLPASDARQGRLRWWAVLVALLLHGLVLASLLWDWRLAPAPMPEVVPVRLVVVPPPAPPPPPPPAPEAAPQPPPPNFAYRESGKDERTTAPPEAPKEAPEPETPPPAGTPEAKAEEPPPPPPEKPALPQEQKGKPHKDIAKLEPPKPAAAAVAPRQVQPRHLNMAPGEEALSGDPYLNALRRWVERHRVYPNVKGQFGLPVQGTPVYGMLIDRSGSLLQIAVIHSSGVPELDQAGREMLTKAAPFPHLPPDWPDQVGITVSLPLYPNPG